MSSVRIAGLRVELGGQAVIDGLDLQVAEGEFLVLLGPSGCGKSTLLHSIAGLVDVAQGSVFIGDEDLTWAEPCDRHIGMVFQSYALYPTMNVERNLSFGLRVRGAAPALVERRVREAAQLLQLEPLLRRRPAQLSGGQRQRVAIGRALVGQAKVLLFDEPLSNLDAQLRAELRRELKGLHERLGSTMIYVTHDQVEAMTLADRIVVLRGGRIQQIGTPAQVYGHPQNVFVAGFVGAPPMNLLPGQLLEEGGALHFCAGTLRMALAAGAVPAHVRGGAVVLGVRAEHVCLDDGGALEGAVRLVEPMGHYELVWMECGGGRLAASHSRPGAFSVDQRVRFDLAAAGLCWFDAGSGERLAGGAWETARTNRNLQT